MIKPWDSWKSSTVLISTLVSSTLLSLILVISYAYIENPVIPKHIIEAKSEHISFSWISSTFNSNYIKSIRKTYAWNSCVLSNCE